MSSDTSVTYLSGCSSEYHCGISDAMTRRVFGEHEIPLTLMPACRQSE